MVGVWSCLVTPKVVVVVEAVVEVTIWSVMNVVNLDILHESVVLVHGDWVVEDGEVLPLDVAAGVPVMMVMGAGVMITFDVF